MSTPSTTGARETTQEAIDKLAALTPDRIAPWLVEHGYGGVPFVADLCVLAQYLGDKTGVVHTVVGEYVINTDEHSTVVLPDHLYAFTRAFDRGDFAELVQ